MNRFPMVPALLIVACLAAPLFAQNTPDKGEPGRDWGSSNWIGESAPKQMGQPIYSLMNLMGEVVVIIHFDCKDDATMKVLDDLQDLWKEHAGLGLWVMAFERRGARKDALETQMGTAGITFPVSAGGGERYRGDGMPVAWIVGIEGKVEYCGVADGNLAKAVAKEVKKIKYPGLGIPEVAKDAEKAAKAFCSGDYVKARDEAREVMNDPKSENIAKDHCRMIDGKINAMLQQHRMQAQTLEQAGNFEGAIAEWEWVEENFKKGDEGKQAKEEIKRLKKGESQFAEAAAAAQKEKEAEAMRDEILEKANKNPNYDPKPDVQKLIEKYPDTKVAEEFRKRLDANPNPGSGGPSTAPDEATCGGEKPEDLAKRVIENWKKQTIDDLPWCTQPGAMRDGLQTQGDGGFLIKCITVRSYRLGNVWMKDNEGWVEYTWSARFDDNAYYERMMENVPPNVPKDQASSIAKDQTKKMKDMIEKSSHIMRVKKETVTGADGKQVDRWYAVNDPFNDQTPQFRPSYKAR